MSLGIYAFVGKTFVLCSTEAEVNNILFLELDLNATIPNIHYYKLLICYAK